MTEAEDGGPLDEAVYPPTGPHFAVPDPMPLGTFQPWHLGRKQWVRKEQWARAVGRLIDQLGLPDRPLRYLGLPGTDLLDVEVLAVTCAGKGKRLRYLGFNSGGQSDRDRTTQRLAEEALRSLNVVDDTSKVVPDDILTLASSKSVAASRLKDFESFDVVNLDLCGAFCSTDGRPLHAAVKAILEYQLARRGHPWLLFVTAAVDPEAMPADEVERYRAIILANAARSPDFRSNVGELRGKGEGAAWPADPFHGVTCVEFGKLLSVAIGKWVAQVVRGGGEWTVELKSCVGYRRGLREIAGGAAAPAGPEMFSLVFGLERSEVTLPDEVGLAKGAAVRDADPRPNPELAMAIQMAKKAARTIDLDCLMQREPERHSALVAECASMLRFRNYDPEAYRAWATALPVLTC